MFTTGKSNLIKHDLLLSNRFDESIISGAMVLDPDFREFIESLNANGDATWWWAAMRSLFTNTPGTPRGHRYLDPARRRERRSDDPGIGGLWIWLSRTRGRRLPGSR